MPQCMAKYEYEKGTTYFCFRESGHTEDHADFVGSWNRAPVKREKLDVEKLTRLAIATKPGEKLPDVVTWPGDKRQ